MNTEEPADSVEFVGDVALVGTYDLRTATNTKHGSVRRYSSESATLLDVHAMPSAVLDLKVSDDQRLVAVALSDGAVDLCDANNLERVVSMRLAAGNDAVLAMAVEWSDRKSRADASRSVVASFSDGRVALFDAERGCSVSEWSAHRAEAWTVAFDCWQPAVVMSGADDSCFKLWDSRGGVDAPVGVLRYDAGVTAVQSHTAREHCVAVGSYDESIAILDLRALRKPLATFASGGGVWRLKWQPGGGDALLAACMHAGFALLDFDGAALRVREQWFAPHASMAYGADWRRDGQLVGCCSFYDRLFTLRRLPAP